MSRGEPARSTSSSSGGLGVVGALTIAFIVLKLCKVIDWSWRWVLSPVWISVLVVLVVLVFGAVLVWALDSTDRRARQQRRRSREGRPAPDEHGPAHRWGRRKAGDE